MVRITRYLSPTAVNTYLSCPRKYYLRYVRKLRTKPSIYLLRGSIVHDVLCRFNRIRGPPAAESTTTHVQETLLALFEEEWDKASYRLRALKLGATRLDQYREESRSMVTNFGLWVTETPLSPATSAELKLFSKKLELMGVVDAVHEVGKEVLLVDYKTSRRAEITPDMERQAALYCLLYQDQYGTVPSEIWFHFLATRDNPEVIQVDENLLQYGTILIDNIRRRTVSDDERDYPCTCGGRCRSEFIPA